MADEKYTPGKWRIVNTTQGACMIMHPTEKGFALAVLTKTFKPRNGYWYDKIGKIAERQGNAELIARAPELDAENARLKEVNKALLEACKDAYAKSEFDHSAPGALKPITQKLLADAIALAEKEA